METFEEDTMSALMSAKPKSNTDITLDIKVPKVISRYQDINTTIDKEDYLENIRKVIKDVGRSTSPLRLTESESDALEDMVHNIKKKSKLKTDKNQAVRISLNFILDDYEQNGKNSIIVQVLERLYS